VLKSHASNLVREGHRFVQAVRLPFTGDALVSVLSASNTPLESRFSGLSEMPGIEGQMASFIDLSRTVLFIAFAVSLDPAFIWVLVARESVRGASGNDHAIMVGPAEVFVGLRLVLMQAPLHS